MIEKIDEVHVLFERHNNGYAKHQEATNYLNQSSSHMY